jgi:single-stranded-DNA-specific exonuclease
VLNQRLLGEKHLKLSLKKDSTVLDAIYFNQAEFLPETIQTAYQLQTNSYNGTQKVQLNLRFVAN